MIGSMIYHPINVLTDKGITEIKNILPGDKVFEYRTGELLEVLDVCEPKHSLIHKITYNDRRVEFIRNSDNNDYF